MGKKNKKRFEILSFDEFEEDDGGGESSIPNEKQNLMILLDRKMRKGKDVTLVTRYVGDEEDLKVLCKELKQKLGTGGSVKDGELVIQGDVRKRVYDLLLERGYTRTKLR
jgi:translation initiation factor 1